MVDSFQELLQFIEEKTAFQCHGYKPKPLIRRIRVRMRSLNIKEFSDYHIYLRQHPDELSKLLDILTINLSYFYRNPETFEYMSRELIPRIADRPKLCFWSAGCAHGEEAYSLALLASEAGILDKTEIFGTDIDRDAIQKAAKGSYPDLALQYLPRILRTKYFTEGDGACEINGSMRKAVRFMVHDLFTSPPFPPCDLVMCRNVLIYMDRAAQSKIMCNLHGQLKSGGYLAIGKVELLLGVPEVQLFQLISRGEHIFRKT